MNNVREMNDQQIKNHYYALIHTSRKTFNEQQKIERVLESPILMSCYMVLWLSMGFIFFFFIWIAPKEGFQLFLFFGLPLIILLITTRYLKRQWRLKEQNVKQIHYQLDVFRAKLKKSGKEIPAYTFTHSIYSLNDDVLNSPFDEYPYDRFED
ncbi:hypothetical protein LGQ02_09410 [Bacillus shivajii]|uniref:hypothetical protein n=1 Tax=Bacillus shivajii TaxID=1983719 RepID=UPI001CFAAB50|nr:hypothetical protein [Bacillus shivajii]UCZ54939.1 hypothetical protein LGQ02_09410 [Bacillus shivajii]